MGVFRKQLAIDCGSYKTVISDVDGKVLLDELSLIYQVHGDVSFIGNMVPLVHGKGEPVAPILDYESGGKYFTKKMLSHFLQKAAGKVCGVIRPKLEVVFSLPVGDEANRMRNIASSLFVEKMSFIEQPIAAAMGIGLDVSSEHGNMIVDIGHRTTDIAIVSNGQIICSSSIPYAGRRFNEDIQHYLEERCDLCVGEMTAQRIKHEVGAAIRDLPQEEIPDNYYVRGSNVSRSGWCETYISHDQIASCLDASLTTIETEIKTLLDQTPPVLIDDITKNGIWLVGGSSHLRGVCKRFSDNLNLKCHMPNAPELVNACGAACSVARHIE